MEYPVLRGHKDHQDLLDPREGPVLMAFRVFQDRLEFLEFRVNQVNKVSTVLKVSLEKEVFRENPDHQEHQAYQAPLVSREYLEREVYRDQRDSPDPLDLRVNKALMELQA